MSKAVRLVSEAEMSVLARQAMGMGFELAVAQVREAARIYARQGASAETVSTLEALADAMAEEMARAAAERDAEDR